MLWERTYVLSSLSERTRKSNHLQMSLQSALTTAPTLLSLITYLTIISRAQMSQ